MNKEERDKLVLDNIAFVHNIVNKYDYSEDKESLVQ